MIEFIAVTIVLVALGVILWWSGWLDEVTASVRDERDRQRLRSELLARDAEVGRAYRQARREMNRVAGQEWRNRFE